MPPHAQPFSQRSSRKGGEISTIFSSPRVARAHKTPIAPAHASKIAVALLLLTSKPSDWRIFNATVPHIIIRPQLLLDPT
jgi:hypothetical protein